MKFQILDIIPHLKNPVTGEIVSTADRLNQVVRTAQLAEELGYDSFSVGERHAGEFISSSPTIVLAAIAAVTSRIRLQSGVTVLSVLDPVRVAEDYATIDQLSRGRLELVISKGNEVLSTRCSAWTWTINGTCWPRNTGCSGGSGARRT